MLLKAKARLKAEISNYPNKNKNKIFPIAGTQIYFSAATIVARSVEKVTKPIKGSSAHRTQLIKVEDGFFVIGRDWHFKKR
jgi:hypothetical protein